jgi:hypothetical protein
MMRKSLVRLVVVTAVGTIIPVKGFADDSRATPRQTVVKKVPGVLTLLSLGHEPRKQAAHTYVITHGLNGKLERFVDLAQAILRAEPGANVLVVDWSPGAAQHLGVGSMRLPNFLAVALRIDPTGDALGTVLAALHEQGLFRAAEATFIGHSFGNYVNNRAAQALRKAKLGKVKRGLLLNPATAKGSYTPPVVRENYTQSVCLVTPSALDTHRDIADRRVDLKTPSNDGLAQHTFGVLWLRQWTQAGKAIGALFTWSRPSQ